MPTIHREGGFEVMVNTDDHPPPHVHVKYAGGVVLINIGTEKAPPSVRKIVHMRLPDVGRAVRVVEQNQAKCLAAWERYHGT
jgi:Domain of unknown function (DUF4160)